MRKGNPYNQRSSVGSKCCGVVEKATSPGLLRGATRTQPQPWIVRKAMVGFTLAMMAYTVYVFVGRLCVDMIRGREHAGGSRGTGSESHSSQSTPQEGCNLCPGLEEDFLGKPLSTLELLTVHKWLRPWIYITDPVVLLIVFSILWLWMIWAYAKVVCTSPGYAKDCVSKSHRPMYPEPTNSFIPYDNIVENSRYPARMSHSNEPSRDIDQEFIGGPSYEDLSAHQPVNTSKLGDNTVPRSEKTKKDSNNSSPRKPELVYTRQKDPADYLHRRPPSTPILRPEHRYCEIDRIVKPYRTHHCRNCGTCVLKYDHHCPWIGQCVGARNQKFFMNFVQAASIFTLYTFVTLIVFVVLRAISVDGHIDPQKIVIIAMSGLFAIFTTAMQFTHVKLIWSGQTTLESMRAHHMKHREKQAMNDVIGYWAIITKRRKARSYDEEWGRIGREGNIWWLGSGKKGWVDVMGHSVWGWFLPIGRSLNDGLTYPVNPRFDTEGLWRRRGEWPKELQ